MSKELSSVWLVPTEADVLKVSPVVKDLAQRYATVPFLPHITIWGEVMAPLDDVEDAVTNAVLGITPFVVNIEKLDYTTEWAKTLYAQIKPNEILDMINRRLGKKLSRYGSYVLNPHMSLIYKKEMTEEEKLREIPNVRIPNSLTLDRIAITVPRDPIAKWENVARWSTPYLIRFNS